MSVSAETRVGARAGISLGVHGGGVANPSVPDLLWAAGSAALVALAGIVSSLASRANDRAIH